MAPAPLRLLVVDDYEDLAHSLAALLTDAGHEPHVAHDGPSALLLAAEVMPNAAIIDVELPRMSGMELGRELRALPGLEQLPLIALSSHPPHVYDHDSRAAGFHANLQKGADVGRLQEVLTGLIAELAKRPRS